MKLWDWDEESVKECMPFICSADIKGLWEYWQENKKDL
jgi:chloramphenicol O-acetyltransferase type B